jgi:uncharacterized protein
MQIRIITNKIILGTAQFGLQYGINNMSKQLTQDGASEILNYAWSNGINILDTADAYGNASDRIGVFHQERNLKFKVITKFKDISGFVALENWIEGTLKRLNVSELFCGMFHSVMDYNENAQLLESLAFFKEKNLIQNIGVSIYTNEQFEQVLKDPIVQLIQLPYNLLDNRSVRGELIEAAKAKGKIIHVRSVFLQGLFFMDLAQLPLKLRALKKELNILHELCLLNNISMQTLALNYVASNPFIDNIIIGIDNLTQLKSNIEAMNEKIPHEIFEIVDSIKTKHSELLMPTNWL